MAKFFWFFITILSVFSLCAQADDDDDTPKEVSIHQPRAAAGEQNIIALNKSAQQAAGIKTIILKSTFHRAEIQSYGIALSIEPLLNLQNQYLTAVAQQKSAQAKVNFSQNHVNRLNFLHNEQIVSTRVLQDQQLTLQTDKAALTSSHYLTQQIINNAHLVWGKTLTNWLINTTAAFNSLVHQQTTLLKIIFPSQSALNVTKTVFVAPTGQREQAVVAELISIAPQSDNFSQGQPYFYQTSAHHIKSGMRVNVWIPQQAGQTGVSIPETALLWHLGQAFVFVKIANQQFIRRAIPDYSKIAGGYFVSAALKPGEEIVSTGAQMLLSQEFKGQIPDEDD